MKWIVAFLLSLLCLSPSFASASATSSPLSRPVAADTVASRVTPAAETHRKKEFRALRKQLKQLKRGEDGAAFGLLLGLIGTALIVIARFYAGFFPLLSVAAGIIGFLFLLAAFWLTGIDFTQVFFWFF